MKKLKPDAAPRSTIVASPMLGRRQSAALLSSDPSIEMLPDGTPGQRHFKIKCASTFARRSSAGKLLFKRYSWRGYAKAELPVDEIPNRITLTALDEGAAIIGTITVGLDGPEGLHSEDAFSDLVGELRNEGVRLCEFTKLAADPTSSTKRVIAALFHVAFALAYRVHRCEAVIIEVNPRHVRYYERMLGFRAISDVRENRAVKAAAVLLRLDLEYAAKQIEMLGGSADESSGGRSLYPFFFPIDEEIRIVAKLAESQRAPVTSFA